jgi:NAD(P)-dependent dehydrogenase (short-subunit alcohol dehydrogenase family)
LRALVSDPRTARKRMKTLKGRVAVVTGSANGIGRAIATALAAEGMSLVLADIEAEAVQLAAKQLEASGAAAHGVTTDVSDAESVDALAQAALERFGAVHVLCNNAAVAGQFGRTWATSRAEWDWVFAVNVMGVVNGLRSFLPILLEQEEGHVVNTGSAACFEALPGFGPYAASKHAVLGISEALARELTGSGKPIGVTVAMPGGVVRTSIMTGARNWLDRFGERPAADDDPLPSAIRAGFTHAVDNGVDPARLAAATVEGIKSGAYLVCDDPELMATWSERHAGQGRGDKPTWPPA